MKREFISNFLNEEVKKFKDAIIYDPELYGLEDGQVVKSVFYCNRIEEVIHKDVTYCIIYYSIKNYVNKGDE